MPTNQTIRWTAIGRRLDMGADADQEISITEINRSFSMGDGYMPYGVAVDAPLAIQLIRNFWLRLKEQVPDENAWIRKTLEKSRAITLDKNMLLKVLSQPESEGLRFYLCLKNTNAGEEVFSLVVVGVDENGKDLLYEYNRETHQSGIRNVATTSLIAEYGHPPGMTDENDTSGIDPFVLFRYSENI